MHMNYYDYELLVPDLKFWERYEADVILVVPSDHDLLQRSYLSLILIPPTGEKGSIVLEYHSELYDADGIEIGSLYNGLMTVRIYNKDIHHDFVGQAVVIDEDGHEYPTCDSVYLL